MELRLPSIAAFISVLLLIGAGASVAQEDVKAIANPVDVILPSSTVAAAAAAGAASGVPKARLRRNSLQQAAMALSNATATVLIAVEPAPEVNAAAVCGANSLTPTNFNVHCRIVSTFPDRSSSSCSAAKIGDNRLATAGHCVYSKLNGGWARAVDVYCTGQYTCGVARTAVATNIATTRRWMDSTTMAPNAWDVAVIRTVGTLPGTALSIGQYSSTGTARARLTGYTGSRKDVNGCSGYNGCTQFSSTDSMQVTSSGMYTSNTMDACAGNSGGAVVDAASNILAAVVSGERTSNGMCVENLFAPSIADKNVDEGTACTRTTGGVSIPCLSRTLPA